MSEEIEHKELVVPNGSRQFTWEDFQKRKARRRAQKRLQAGDAWRTEPLKNLFTYESNFTPLGMNELLNITNEISPGCYRRGTLSSNEERA